MGNRRFSRKRLFEVEKRGQAVDLESGAGIKDAIVSATQHRQGQEIITEIAVDLGTSKAAIVGGGADEAAVGVAGKPAFLTRLTTAKFGIVTEIRAVVVEALSTGPDILDLNLNSAVVNTASDVTDGNVIADTSVQDLSALGEDTSRLLDLNTKAANNYLYITNGTSASRAGGTYDGGKLLIYIHGFVAPDDI